MGTPDVTVRRFDILTEADARHIEPGATVEVAAGGRVTPLALESLAGKKVTVVRLDAADAPLPADLVPASTINRVAIGSDHGGVALKAALIAQLRGMGRAVTDHGTYDTR